MDFLLEEYQFNYDLFLAEQELFRSMTNLGSLCINESIGLISLEEGIKETVVNYITKVTTALQKLWDNIKEKFIENKSDKSYLSIIKEKIASVKPNFTINNLPNFDMEAVKNIQVVPFNYEEMKPYLDTKDAFIKQYYSQYMKDDQKSLKENIMSIGIPGIEAKKKCDSDTIKNMFTFCNGKFHESMEQLKNDLSKFNSSTQNITNIASTITSSETSATEEAVMFYECLLLEVGEDNKKNASVSYEPNSDENDQQTNAGFAKHIANYISVSVDIITTKMNIYRKAYTIYLKTLMYCIKPQKKEDTEDNKQETTGEVKTKVDVS